jgi:hypothetical protein
MEMTQADIEAFAQTGRKNGGMLVTAEPAKIDTSPMDQVCCSKPTIKIAHMQSRLTRIERLDSARRS